MSFSSDFSTRDRCRALLPFSDDPNVFPSLTRTFSASEYEEMLSSPNVIYCFMTDRGYAPLSFESGADMSIEEGVTEVCKFRPAGVFDGFNLVQGNVPREILSVAGKYRSYYGRLYIYIFDTVLVYT